MTFDLYILHLMVNIVPSLLEKTVTGISDKLKRLNGITDYVQIDIVKDWPNGENTLSLEQLKSCSGLAKLKTEIHLMTQEPIRFLPGCQKIKAVMVYGQIEQMADRPDFIRRCRTGQLKVGLAVDLPTFINRLKLAELMAIDGVLLMSIEAGAQGKKFNRRVLGKLQRLVRLKRNYGLNFTIAIDGGINDKTGKWCRASGANQLCVGSYLFKAADLQVAWEKLHQLRS